MEPVAEQSLAGLNARVKGNHYVNKGGRPHELLRGALHTTAGTAESSWCPNTMLHNVRTSSKDGWKTMHAILSAPDLIHGSDYGDTSLMYILDNQLNYPKLFAIVTLSNSRRQPCSGNSANKASPSPRNFTRSSLKHVSPSRRFRAPCCESGE